MIGSKATGIAVIFGAVSGWLAAADFDRMDTYNDWQHRQPELAKALPTVETARGRHCYFRGEGRTTKFNGGDLKYSGYCVVPPSVHPSGSVYRWLIPFDGNVPTILEPEAAGFRLVHPCNDTHGCTNFPTHGCTSPPDKGAFVSATIAKTLPSGPGNRHRRIFDLARRLKFSGFDFSEREQREIVGAWLEGAILAGTKDRDFAQTWNEFIYAWENAKEPITGGGTLAKAKATAQQTPGALQDRLLALCRFLAGTDGAFFLSYGNAADATGCTKRGAYKAMMELRDSGRLVLVKRGEPKLGGLATEWRLPD